MKLFRFLPSVSVMSTKRCICCLHFLVFLIAKGIGSTASCRNLEFTGTRTFKGKRFTNHVMRIAYVKGQEFCEVLCFLDDYCFSYNFKTKTEGGKQKCELNNATHEGHEREVKEDVEYEYYAVEV